LFTAYKPAHKTVSKRLPFTPATLTDCEPHILESNRAEWKRVKEIWKELKHEKQTNDSGGAPPVDQQLVQGTGEADQAVGKVGPGPGATSALLGELSLLLGLGVNTGSNSEGGDSQWFLYEVCGLPRIYENPRTGKYSRESEKEHKARVGKGAAGRKRKAGKSAHQEVGVKDDSQGHKRSAVCDRETQTTDQNAQVQPATVEEAPQPAAKSSKKISTGQQALDLLYAYTRDERALWVLQQRRLRKVVSDLKGDLADHDGRARSSVSFVKETGRMAEAEAPHGTGLGNRQALNKDLRRVVVAG
jgi:hypothetical protein